MCAVPCDHRFTLGQYELALSISDAAPTPVELDVHVQSLDARLHYDDANRAHAGAIGLFIGAGVSLAIGGGLAAGMVALIHAGEVAGSLLTALAAVIGGVVGIALLIAGAVFAGRQPRASLTATSTSLPTLTVP